MKFHITIYMYPFFVEPTNLVSCLSVYHKMNANIAVSQKSKECAILQI